MRNKHDAPRKQGPVIKCSECSYSHLSQSRVKAHITLKHTVELKFKCLKCSKAYKSKIGLKRHTGKVHRQEISSTMPADAHTVPVQTCDPSLSTPSLPVSTSNLPVHAPSQSKNVVAKKSLPPSNPLQSPTSTIQGSQQYMGYFYQTWRGI